MAKMGKVFEIAKEKPRIFYEAIKKNTTLKFSSFYMVFSFLILHHKVNASNKGDNDY